MTFCSEDVASSLCRRRVGSTDLTLEGFKKGLHAQAIFTCSWRSSLCLLRINNLDKIINVIKQHT
jgi:hypothetical protein